jgi:hypothetical protein
MTRNQYRGDTNTRSRTPSASHCINISHHAGHAPRPLSNSIIAAALSGVSVFAISAALIAVQTDPAMAACASQSSNNVTGFCNGPITPISGGFTNSGSIGGGGLGVSVDDGTIISTFTNTSSGTIAANGGSAKGIFIFSPTWTNSAPIKIGTLTNDGLIRVQSNDSSAYIFGISNAKSSIGTLTNNGTIIVSTTKGTVGATGIYTTGVIQNLTNTGLISATIGSVPSGIVICCGNEFAPGAVGILINQGSIYAERGIDNSGSIGTLQNLGVIHGSDVNDINIANEGTIGTLINAQGGNGSLPAQTAMTYAGNLPGTYLEYVTSTTHYGQLAVTDGAGTIGSFGIAAGSTLAIGTYASVLSGVGTVGTISGLNGSITGTISGSTWALLNRGSDIWDLIISGLISGPDAVNTLLELGYTRDDILKALRNRAAVMNSALNHDCLTFDTNGVCIGFNARYSSMDSQNDGAGVMTAAMRLSPNTHLGVCIDYAGKPNTQGAVAYGDEMPMFGGFLGYAEKPDGTSLQGRLSAAYHTGDVTITRPDTLENTEAGSGKTSLTHWAIGAELGYGFAMSKQSNLTPYIGLRYGTAAMAGYTEGSSDAVQYPITYNGFSQNLTTAIAGLRLSGMLNDKMSYQLSGGIEYDLQSDANAFSWSSTIADIASSVPNTANANRLRGNASLALGYAIAPNQKLTTSVSVRGEAYSDEADTNVMAGYEIGF